MGNTLAMEAVKGVRFLRNTCSTGMKEHSGGSPSEPEETVLLSPRSSPELPPSGMVRNSVVRKALRRPSKGIKKNGSVSLDGEEVDSAVMLESKVGIDLK